LAHCFDTLLYESFGELSGLYYQGEVTEKHIDICS